MVTAVFFFKQHSFSLWFCQLANLIGVWMPFCLTVILSKRLKAFLQIKQSLMVGRLHEMHVSERSEIDWFFEKIRLFCLIALDKIWKTIIRRELRHTHSTVGRWKKRGIFRQAPRRQVQRAPQSATSYRRCVQLSDATVSKQLLLQKKVFDKNCRGSCRLQLLPEKLCDITKIKKDIRSKKNFNRLFIFIIDF